jgi:hypothetical protein
MGVAQGYPPFESSSAAKENNRHSVADEDRLVAAGDFNSAALQHADRCASRATPLPLRHHKVPDGAGAVKY